MNHFKVAVHTLDSQSTFETLTRLPGQLITNTDAEGRPIVPPGFYITSYTQLATNGVAPIPDPFDWDPRALLAWLALGVGPHQEMVIYSQCDRRPCRLPAFADVCMLFAWRAIRWQDEYDLLNFTPSKTIEEWTASSGQAGPPGLLGGQESGRERAQALYKAHEVLQNLCTHTPSPKFSDLNRRQQDWVIREFCAAKVAELSAGIGEVKAYLIGRLPPGYIADKPETDTRPKRYVKCLFSPSLADLCWNAFAAVVIDEGVKMKGEDTIVGTGVRQINARLTPVLTATPIKNRLPDVFRLAWWATGGPQGPPRFPYPDETAARESSPRPSSSASAT